MRGSSKAAWLLASAIGLAALGCDELLIRAANLQVVPDPAQQGEEVSFVFDFTLIPERNYTITASIDGMVHRTETRMEAFDGVFVLRIGDAGDLISTYGVGTRTAHIAVRDNDGGRTAQTASVPFELQ